MPDLTERQQVAMTARVVEAKSHDVDMSEFQPWDSAWHGRFEEESRPGRGHDFNGVWCDGQKIVQVSIDVYGYGYMSIGGVDWTHGGEDCECDVCIREMKAAKIAESGVTND
jgi:hypothetical protein